MKCTITHATESPSGRDPRSWATTREYQPASRVLRDCQFSLVGRYLVGAPVTLPPSPTDTTCVPPPARQPARRKLPVRTASATRIEALPACAQGTHPVRASGPPSLFHSPRRGATVTPTRAHSSPCIHGEEPTTCGQKRERRSERERFLPAKPLNQYRCPPPTANILRSSLDRAASPKMCFTRDVNVLRSHSRQ